MSVVRHRCNRIAHTIERERGAREPRHAETAGSALHPGNFRAHIRCRSTLELSKYSLFFVAKYRVAEKLNTPAAGSGNSRRRTVADLGVLYHHIVVNEYPNSWLMVKRAATSDHGAVGNNSVVDLNQIDAIPEYALHLIEAACAVIRGVHPANRQVGRWRGIEIGLSENSVRVCVVSDDAAGYLYVGRAFDHHCGHPRSETGIHILNHRIAYSYVARQINSKNTRVRDRGRENEI